MGGMAYDTARDALAKLVDAGMLDRQAVELGGMEKRAKLAERIREERARPRGDSIRLAPGDVLDIDENVYDDDLRRWHEEEHMRQLGLI